MVKQTTSRGQRRRGAGQQNTNNKGQNMQKQSMNQISQRAAAGVTLGVLALGVVSAQAQAPATPPAQPIKSRWESTVAAGLSLTSGNSDTMMANATFATARKWPQNELFFGANGNYGENDGKQNVGSAGAFGQYNHLFSERFYAGFRADALYDVIAHVDYRFTLSPLAGYYLVKNDRTRLSVEASPSFVFEKLGGKSDSYVGLRLAERFEHKLNDRSKVWESLEYIPQIDRFSNYLINAEVGIDTSITKALSLRVVLQDSFDNEPAPGRKQNDLKLIAGVAYKF
jgi:putative salt-induced outer membrane protein YdiY